MGVLAVTGAAGTIGSAVVERMAESRRYEKIRAIDHDENGLYRLSERLRGNLAIRYVLADVRDRVRIAEALDGVGAVVHAAALKHVALCEENPVEAVETNVGGTVNVWRAACRAGCQRMLLISTDKAADPGNVMGASKLLAERCLAVSRHRGGTTAYSIRFGNVFGSRGSVVPTWLGAQQRCSRIRLTDPCCTRYSVTRNEATRRIDKALFLSDVQGGGVLSFEMQAYRLGDLAMQFQGPREMVGLRPGERMHERLFAPTERVVRADGWLKIDPSGEEWTETSETCRRLQDAQLRGMLEDVKKEEPWTTI